MSLKKLSKKAKVKAALELLNRRKARRGLLDFMKYAWWSGESFKIGRHTREICGAIDEAVEKYLCGESSFLDIAVVYRHGKSDMVSRALPAYFLGRCMELQPDIILTGYGGSLVEGFSRDVKKILRSPRYMKVFPKIELSKDANNVAEWRVEGSVGKVTVAGLGGSIMGKGGHLIIVDDFCKSREEADSEIYRDKMWRGFTDVLSRRAPTSIVIVCATSWHVDDVRERIKQKEKEDEDFPRFKRLFYPAKNGDGSWLFPERFSEQWYREQYATYEKYESSALMDCNPIIAGGNVAKVDWFKVIDEEPGGLRKVRFWDFAGTRKKRSDWTVGCLIGEKDGNYYILDIKRGQWEPGEIEEIVVRTAEMDGGEVFVYWEEEPGGSGKYVTASFMKLLAGYVCEGIPCRRFGSNEQKVLSFFAQARGGNVYLLRGEWNHKWINEITEFPDGKHDDQAVSSGGGFNVLVNESFIPIDLIRKLGR